MVKSSSIDLFQNKFTKQILMNFCLVAGLVLLSRHAVAAWHPFGQSKSPEMKQYVAVAANSPGDASNVASTLNADDPIPANSWNDRLRDFGVNNNDGLYDTFSEDLTSHHPIIPFDPRMVQDPKHFLSQIPIVVYVNIADQGKGSLAQRAIIYVNGKEYLRSLISSGKPGHSTVTGYFYGDSAEINHKSSKYGSYMPFSVFWYSGYATHQAPVGSEGLLGNRASHGCVRLPRQTAQIIYNLVKKTGRGTLPKFSRRGVSLGERTDSNRYLQIAVVVENNPAARF